jgi:hypothetical protein
MMCATPLKCLTLTETPYYLSDTIIVKTSKRGGMIRPLQLKSKNLKYLAK